MKGRCFAFILAFFCALQLGAQTTPRVLLFADQEYSRLQIKVKGGSYTLTAYTPDSIFAMDYGPDDVHPLYTFRGIYDSIEQDVIPFELLQRILLLFGCYGVRIGPQNALI